MTGRSGRASARMTEMCDTFVAKEYREKVRSFFDLSTLKERLKTEETVAVEYLAENGSVTNVLYATRLISDEKRREQYRKPAGKRKR